MTRRTINVFLCVATCIMGFCTFTFAMESPIERCGLIARTHEAPREIKHGIWFSNPGYRDVRSSLGKTTRPECFKLCKEKKEDLETWEKDLKVFTCLWGDNQVDI